MPIFHLTKIILFIIILFIYNISHAQIQPEIYSGFISKKLVSSKKQMVVTANKYASKAAIDILNNGGNALDAAIAAQMVLNVVEPQSSGIGGGGFLLYYNNKDKKIYAFDGRETAPNNIKDDIFLNKDNSPKNFFDMVQGGISVGTPGLLKMLSMAHMRFGNYSWNNLFDEAINLSENGFKISARLNKLLNHSKYLRSFTNSNNLYYKNNEALRIGTILKNPDLAKTFKLIANTGISAFYNGDIGKNIIYEIQNSKINPGTMDQNDLSSYQAKIQDAICQNYRKYKICGMPPPSSGAFTILQALGMLENYNFNENNIFSKEAVKKIIGAMKLAFADRNKYIADNDFVAIPIERLLDKNYLLQRYKLINDNPSPANPGNINMFLADNHQNFERNSTTHISIIDQFGNGASLTSSIEHAFGSGLMVDGFLLNNQLTDFSFRPTINGLNVANKIEPKKRPRSSMSPTIIFDENNQLYMIIGSPGGSRIIPYVLQIIISVLDWNMNLQDAVNYPHIVNLNKNYTEIEHGNKIDQLVYELEYDGYHIERKHLDSGINAILIKDDVIFGAADPRREGIAMK